MAKNNVEKTKLLIVEDDMIIAADISMQLTKLSYDIVGVNTRAEDALSFLEKNRPDLILMDVILGGEMNGITAAKIIKNEYNIPLIFLTSNTDDATFQNALTAKPFAFIPKPFRKSELERTLRLTMQRIEAEKINDEEQVIITEKENEHIAMMEDRLFVKSKNELLRLLFSDILFIVAEGNYCIVHTEAKELFISNSLRTLEAQLPKNDFLRVHRSYVVNLKHITSIDKNQEELTIGNLRVPISRRSKEDVVKRINQI